MTATYTFDVFSSLDGFGAASGNWTGYWGKQGPELLAHRLAQYSEEQRLVIGATTYRAFEGDAGRQHGGFRGARPVGHQAVEPSGDGDLDDPDRTAELAERESRQR